MGRWRQLCNADGLNMHAIAYQKDGRGNILVGNQWIDPEYYLFVGTDKDFDLGIFSHEHEGLHYRWLTPEERHQLWVDQEASHHFVVCPRSPVSDWLSVLPAKYVKSLEANETLRPCCRNAVDHEIEAFSTNENDKQRGIPDLYVFHCKCGRKHRRLCGGTVDTRPFWEIR